MRLRMFGHIGRLPSKTSTYRGLRLSKRPIGGQRLTLPKLIEKQVPNFIGINEAIKAAQDRDKNIINIVD